MSPGALATNAASPTAAVLRNRDAGPMRVDRLPYDPRKIRRDFQRLQATAGRVRACYEASSRPYVRRPTPLTYPEHFELRWVSQLGMIRWKARFVRVTKLLAFHHVGLEQISDGLWSAYFGPRHLGWLDESDFRIMHL